MGVVSHEVGANQEYDTKTCKIDDMETCSVLVRVVECAELKDVINS